jgi:hypothetical protein
MTVNASHRVNVVAAFRIGEGGIHLLHIQPAVGQARMAAGARLPGVLAVILVAAETTDALVNPHWRAIVA